MLHKRKKIDSSASEIFIMRYSGAIWIAPPCLGLGGIRNKTTGDFEKVMSGH